MNIRIIGCDALNFLKRAFWLVSEKKMTEQQLWNNVRIHITCLDDKIIVDGKFVNPTWKFKTLKNIITSDTEIQGFNEIINTVCSSLGCMCEKL